VIIKKLINCEFVNEEVPSVGMFSNAQSLAKIASKMSDKDNGTIISRETWEEMHDEPKVVRENFLVS
jgi:hypothetical protein